MKPSKTIYTAFIRLLDSASSYIKFTKSNLTFLMGAVYLGSLEDGNEYFIIISFIIFILLLLGLSIDYFFSRKRRHLVVELSGLRQNKLSPLEDEIYIEHKGKVVPVEVSCSKGLVKDYMQSPDKGLEQVDSDVESLHKELDKLSKYNITMHIGGLMPVPFLFLTSMLIGNKNQLVYDWDRVGQKWSSLDSSGYKEVFEINHVASKNNDKSEDHVIVIPASYDIAVDELPLHLSSLSRSILKFDEKKVGNHLYSADLQSNLAVQFLETLQSLKEKNIATIHLFIAAPSSLVLKLASVVDKRNMPNIIVYQYERELGNKYPWSIQMPTNMNLAKIISYD